jgi:hypothetical protein
MFAESPLNVLEENFASVLALLPIYFHAGFLLGLFLYPEEEG